MEDPTLGGDWSGMGPDIAANVLTVGMFGLVYALKACCSRESKCKTKFHSCCLDVEMVDRTERADHPPSVSEDQEGENRV